MWDLKFANQGSPQCFPLKGDSELALHVHVSRGGTTQEILNALCWQGSTDYRKATFNDINGKEILSTIIINL